jgi:hypothetical protein
MATIESLLATANAITATPGDQEQPIPGSETPFPPAPTPTPSPALPPAEELLVGPDFHAAFVNMNVCGGISTVSFQVDNTGTDAFESFRIRIEDGSSGGAGLLGIVVSDSPFSSSSQECTPEEDSLDSGESAYVFASVMLPKTSGYSGGSVLTLCTRNGLKGRCVEKTLAFTIP